MTRVSRQFAAGLVALGICCVGLTLEGSVAFAAGPPAVDGESVSGATPFEATLEAQINPNERETYYHFEYASNAALVNATTIEGGSTLPPELGDQPVSVGTGGVLAPDTTYYYRAVAENAAGEKAEGTVGHFKTLGAQPSVTTGGAKSLTQTTAALEGTVNPMDVETSYHFAYISEAGYQAALAAHAANPYQEGETTTPLGAGSSEEPQAVGPVLANGLLSGTKYHYALVAENAVGVTVGQDATLTTLPPTPPVVSTEGASGVSQNGATISGRVTTNGLQTNYGFEIGTEAGEYGAATGLGSIGGAGTEAVSATLVELQPGTTYYYRITATNADGTAQGEPVTFTTPGFPSLLAAQVSPPQIATPATAFPTDVEASATPGTKRKTKTKPKIKAQKLQGALKQCHRQPKQKRAQCEKQARAKYGPAKKKKKK
jgi:hypothetical protein